MNEAATIQNAEKIAGIEKDGFLYRLISSFTNQEFLDHLIRNGVVLIVRLLIVYIFYKIGKKLIKLLLKGIDKVHEKSGMDADIHIFTRSVVNIVSYLVLFIVICLIIGVKQSSLVAIFGAAGVGIGFALKDTLSNFAGGLMLLFFKPYKTGDFIEVNGNSGEVQGITVFATELNTIDNKRIIVPNGISVSNEITNYTKNKVRRVEIIFGIGYQDDFSKAIKILEDIASSQEKILQNIEKTIRVKELADSSVNIIFRVWCKKEDYWAVYYDTIEKAKATFDKEGISIPFPQRDIHIIKDINNDSELQ